MPCREASDKWLDYRVTPGVKIASGASRDDTPAGVADARRARYEAWRNTIQNQQDLIRKICADKHQAVEIYTLNPAYGPDVETRARCQDDGHPVGAVHPYWFGPDKPGSVCHCGRVVRHGVHDVDRWPRPPMPIRSRPVFA